MGQDYFSIIAFSPLSPEVQQMMLNMAPDSKQNFDNAIGQMTLYIDVVPNYSIDENNNIQAISLELLIFFDGLNKDRFARTIREIGRAYSVTGNICQNTLG